MSPILCRHIRPLLAQSNKRWLGVRLSSSAAKHHEPLRVLFCGADAFSIYSLRALHKLQQANPEKIASIDVVCRPDKRVGRGLKKIQEGSYIQHTIFATLHTQLHTLTLLQSPSNLSPPPSPSPSTKSTPSPHGPHPLPLHQTSS